jgi:hypothetical protein
MLLDYRNNIYLLHNISRDLLVVRWLDGKLKSFVGLFFDGIGLVVMVLYNITFIVVKCL